MKIGCWNEDGKELSLLTACGPNRELGHAELDFGRCAIAMTCRR
jgi:hypothetical protein